MVPKPRIGPKIGTITPKTHLTNISTFLTYNIHRHSYETIWYSHKTLCKLHLFSFRFKKVHQDTKLVLKQIRFIKHDGKLRISCRPVCLLNSISAQKLIPANFKTLGDREILCSRICIPAKCQFCLDSRSLKPANFKNLGDREILYPRNVNFA